MIDTILLPLAPVAGIVALGALLRAVRLVGDEGWAATERVAMVVLLPALLFHGAATADTADLPLGPGIAAAVLALLIVLLAYAVMRPRLGIGLPERAALLQGSVRPNAYVALGVATALHADAAAPAAAIAVLAFLPLANLIAVVAHARLARGVSGMNQLLRRVFLNPPILAAAAGFATGLSGIPIPEVAATVLDTLGAAAVPVGLLAAGAAMGFRGPAGATGPALVATSLKLVLLPAALLFWLNNMGVYGPAATVLLIFAAAPVAASSVRLARRMNGDPDLATRILSLQTLAAMATLPAWLLVKDYFI